MSDRWFEWRYDWLPYRAQKWIGPENANWSAASFNDDRFWGPMRWYPPQRGPFRWIMRAAPPSVGGAT